MKFVSSLVMAAVAAFGASSAMANDVTATVPMTGLTAAFTAIHTDSDPFTDTFTFDVSGSVLATASGITIDLGPGQDVNFSSASLNGSPLTLTSANGGFVETFYTPSALSLTGPLVLSVMGTTNATGSIDSSYAGTLNVMPVPEPETYALLLAGLGVVGFVARRRKTA